MAVRAGRALRTSAFYLLNADTLVGWMFGAGIGFHMVSIINVSNGGSDVDVALHVYASLPSKQGRFLSLSCGSQLHVCGPHDVSVCDVLVFTSLSPSLSPLCKEDAVCNRRYFPMGIASAATNFLTGYLLDWGKARPQEKKDACFLPKYILVAVDILQASPDAWLPLSRFGLISAEPIRLSFQLVCCASSAVTPLLCPDPTLGFG